MITNVLASDPLIYADAALCQATAVYSIETLNNLAVASDKVSITVGG